MRCSKNEMCNDYFYMLLSLLLLLVVAVVIMLTLSLDSKPRSSRDLTNLGSLVLLRFLIMGGHTLVLDRAAGQVSICKFVSLWMVSQANSLLVVGIMGSTSGHLQQVSTIPQSLLLRNLTTYPQQQQLLLKLYHPVYPTPIRIVLLAIAKLI